MPKTIPIASDTKLALTYDLSISPHPQTILYTPRDELMRWGRDAEGNLIVTISSEMEEAAKQFWNLVRLHCPPGSRLESL